MADRIGLAVGADGRGEVTAGRRLQHRRGGHGSSCDEPRQPRPSRHPAKRTRIERHGVGALDPVALLRALIGEERVGRSAGRLVRVEEADVATGVHTE